MSRGSRYAKDGTLLTWEKRIQVGEPNECWHFNGATHSNGRPHAKIGGVNVDISRLTYEKHVGPIPFGFEIHHICDNDWCVYYNHLEALSTKEHGKTRRRYYKLVRKSDEGALGWL